MRMKMTRPTKLIYEAMRISTVVATFAAIAACGGGEADGFAPQGAAGEGDPQLVAVAGDLTNAQVQQAEDPGPREWGLAGSNQESGSLVVVSPAPSPRPAPPPAG